MAAPYDLLSTVADLARVRVNDAIGNGLAGQTMTNTQPFTLVICNAAWRRLQDILRSFGFARLKGNIVFTAVPPTGSSDTGSEVAISWGTSPALPTDMVSPLLMWERVNGTNAIYTPMDEMLNGLPGVPKQSLNKYWEWRDETIYVPGATSTTDIRLRYASFIEDFTAFNNQVKIVDALSPFAWFIASEFCGARGDSDLKYLDDIAVAETHQIWDRDPSQARSIQKAAEYGKMTAPQTPMNGPVSRVVSQ